MKYYSLMGQVLLHFPSWFFLLILVTVIFVLPEDEFSAPINSEVKAHEIVWSRYTETGKIIELRAPLLVRETDGVVRVENVVIDTTQQGNSVQLKGKTGVTDNEYQEILLEDTQGQISNAEGIIELSLVSAIYQLNTAGHLQGNKVQLKKENNRLRGDKLSWDGKNLRLSGNVKAVYNQSFP